MDAVAIAASAPPRATRVAILQSNYIPWKGYFDLIRSCDEFILFDDMQYTRRDWRNRNRIKTPRGLCWLTIPVEVKGRYHQCIRDTRISDPGWARRHFQTLAHHYARTPYWQVYRDRLEALYLGCAETHLSRINHRFLAALCDWLGITTRITCSTDYTLLDGKTERLVDLCRQAAATHYRSGPAGRGYVDAAQFDQAGITLEWMDYAGYPKYPQLHPPFDHHVTVLDLILNVGPEAAAYLDRRPANQPAAAAGESA